MHLGFSLLEAFVWKRYLVSALICSSLVLCLGGRPLFSIVFNYLLEADEGLQQVKLFRTDWHVPRQQNGFYPRWKLLVQIYLMPATRLLLSISVTRSQPITRPLQKSSTSRAMRTLMLHDFSRMHPIFAGGAVLSASKRKWHLSLPGLMPISVLWTVCTFWFKTHQEFNFLDG